MKYKILQPFALLITCAIFLASCIKDDNFELVGDKGKTFLKFLEAPQNTLYFTPFTNVDTLDLFSARKEANSNANLKTATTAKLTSLPALIDVYNDDNGTGYEPLPDSIFTLINSSFIKTADGYNLSFAPGDYAKAFTIALNGSKWDVSHTYALAFAMTVTGDNTALSYDKDTIIVFLSVKNEYDGKYTSTGWLYHPASPRAIGPVDKDVVTAGPSSITVTLGDLGTSGYKALIDIDKATNKLIITTAPGAAGGPYTMFSDGLPSTDPGYSAAWPESGSCNNTYDPATHTFYVRYGYHGGTGWRITEEIIKLK